MKIISKRGPDSGLKVALDVESWEVKPMKYNTKQNQWEYVPNVEGKDLEKIHFKFIDLNDTWFADNDFPKEFDDAGNENNVIYVSEKGLELRDYVNDVKNAGSISPTSTPKHPVASPKKDAPEQTPMESQHDGGNADKSDSEESSTKESNGAVNATRAVDQEQEDSSENRPTTSDTTVTQRGDSIAEYSSFLDRIMLYLKRFVKRWFGFHRSSSS